MNDAHTRPGWLVSALHNLRRHSRLTLCGLIAVVLAVAFTGTGMALAHAILLAFDVAVLLFLAAIGWQFARAKQETIRRYARAADENYWGFLLISVASATIALLALAVQLHASEHGGMGQIVLAACTLVLVWLFINTVFALHYAHEFYGEGDDKHWGLDFPGTDEPDYWDFMYFSLCVGMTFQVSDVEITERGIRHVVTVQSVVAFFFNVVIIALSVNVVAGGM
jgi:uncharacterized membrane protein